MLLTFDYLQAVLLAVDQLVAVSVLYEIAIVVQRVHLGGWWLGRCDLRGTTRERERDMQNIQSEF